MLQIRPVSDLRNKTIDIENIISEGQPVYLTKDGYGSMVVMSIETYSRLMNFTENALDEADYYAENDSLRMTHDEVFSGLKAKINAGE